MHRWCPHYCAGQIESSVVEAIMSWKEKTPDGPETPVVTEQSLKGAGKGAESPGALYEQQVPHTGQRHQQDKTWNLGQ